MQIGKRKMHTAVARESIKCSGPLKFSFADFTAASELPTSDRLVTSELRGS